MHVNSNAKIAMQLGHAGRKASTQRMWEGMDEPLRDGNWPIISASPLPYFPYSQVPKEMTRADMDEVKYDFVLEQKQAALKLILLPHWRSSCC